MSNITSANTQVRLYATRHVNVAYMYINVGTCMCSPYVLYACIYVYVCINVCVDVSMHACLYKWASEVSASVAYHGSILASATTINIALSLRT